MALELIEKLTEREDYKEYRCLVLLRVLRCVAVCCSVLQCVEKCCNVSQSVSLGVYRHQLRHPCFLLCFLPVPLQCLYLPPSSLQRHCVCVCVCVCRLWICVHAPVTGVKKAVEEFRTTVKCARHTVKFEFCHSNHTVTQHAEALLQALLQSCVE